MSSEQQVAAAPVTEPAPATTHNTTTTTTAHAGGPVDDKDVEHWKARFNEVLAKPSEHVNQKSPADAEAWHESFFGCFNPIDLCLMSWCVPCVTFGKTHHRLHKDGNLAGYEPVNTTCLMFWGSMCVGLHWIPMSMQRSEIRSRYHLQGDCITDILGACCCGICSLVQSEKEVAHHGPAAGATNGVQEQYASEKGMAMP